MKHTVLPRPVKVVLCALAMGAAACTPGQIGGGSSGGGGPSPANPGGGGQQPPGNGGGSNPGNGGGGTGGGYMGGNQMPVAPGTVSAGMAPLRRLTADQYRNTVRDLLGLPDRPAMSLPADDAIADRFLSNTTSAVKGVDLDRYADAADALAKAATTPDNLARLVPCDPKAGDAACARQFIERFGRRAYRRPLTAGEIERLEKVHAAGGDFAGGVQLVVTALLQSPKFLYLHEPAPESAAGKVVPVDRYAMASRLSYFMLGTMPDEPLFQAADAGKLGSGDDVAAQADRLSKDPRFGATLALFHSQWLLLHEIGGAEKDPKLFPDKVWNAAIKTALGEESRRFVEQVMTEGDGKLETLLAAPYSVLGGPLFEYYGVARPAGLAADSWAKADLPRDQRAGLLTQGSLLASQAHADKTSFILRGKLVREALLCTPIPPPPADAVNNEVMLPVTATARERAAAHRTNPQCASCHELFDPLGFAFENYDAAGRWRTAEADGKVIDAAVTLTSAGALDGPVKNGIELARKLGGAAEVRDCLTRQWMRFALGREDAMEDGASRTAVAQAFRDGGGKVRDLLVALARSDAFRFQTVQQ